LIARQERAAELDELGKRYDAAKDRGIDPFVGLDAGTDTAVE